MGNWWPIDRSLQAVYVFTFLIIAGSFFWHFSGVDHLFDWTLTATAEKENVVVETFDIGPFSFQIEGQQYIIKEVFGISDISHSKLLSILLLTVVWFGLTGFLAYATYLKRYAFLFVAALYLLFINQLYLDEISLLGSNSWKWPSIVLMISLLLPAYWLHAFKENSPFVLRWGLLFVLSSIVLSLFQTSDADFYLYFAGHGAIGLSILGILFIFLVAEEIIFLVLLFITRSKGGANNEKHFLIFSTVYLGYLGLYWADKMSLVAGDWDYLNPYLLLAVSALISFYSIHHKQELFDALTSKSVDVRWLLSVLAIVAFGLLTFAFARGNDPAADSLNYLILYAHIGFGVMFLLYVIVNLMTPLIQGMMVYKIAYKSHNFPYITAKLAGFIFVVAFYFYSDQAPLRRAQSARLIFLGDYYSSKDVNLGKSYYQESAIFGWDNHYASMKLAAYANKENNISEAVYRYSRAANRNPSPYAFVGAASALQKAEETTRAISTLRGGQQLFPGQAEMLNNLALLYDETGATNEAREVLKLADQTDSWNQAITVNQLAIGQQLVFDTKAEWNWQSLANWQAQINQGSHDGKILFDPSVGEGKLSLPAISYLINTGWGVERNLPDTFVVNTSQKLRNGELSKTLRHSNAYNLIKSGYVNRAIPQWRQLSLSVNSYEKGFYYRQLGNVFLKLSAPRLAKDAFEEAIQFGSEESKASYAIACMEIKDWSSASEMWSQVTKKDSSYSDLIMLTKVLSEPMMMPSFAWLYYNLPSAIEAYDVIAELPESQVQMLWDKLFDRWSMSEKQNDLAILTDRVLARLTSAQQNKYQMYQSTLENIERLSLEEANKNAFETWKIKLVLQNENISNEDKYELLLSAIAVNEYDADLIVSYAQYAIEMGLFEYAESATLRLLTLVSPKEYQRIERLLFDQRQAREERLDQWAS